MYNNIAIIGASGALGNAFLKKLINTNKYSNIHCFSRKTLTINNSRVFSHSIDISSEESISNASNMIPSNISLDLIFVATGILHNNIVKPEKSFSEISEKNLLEIFTVNTFGPALVMRYFLPKLNKESRSLFIAISAKVGSISDNHLGGWYSYRSSKAALNMIIKSAGIELKRKNKKAIIVGIHPGTIDSNISRPFQKNVKHKIYTPKEAAQNIYNISTKFSDEMSGNMYDYKGIEIKS